LVAKRQVVAAGYAAEIEWQCSRVVGTVTREAFVREATWVVLSSGFRESVVVRVFPHIADIVTRLDSVDPDSLEVDKGRALLLFCNRRKIDAIFRIAERVFALAERELIEILLRSPFEFINDLPYMGPATSRHLAKNLGIPVAKPDRHLARLTLITGRESVDALCSSVASFVGDSVTVVDLVLWRWSVLHLDRCTDPSCNGLPHW
jgi:hypothetical protein